MRSFFSTIEFLIIFVLLVICGVLSFQLYQYHQAYGQLSTKRTPTPSPEALTPAVADKSASGEAKTIDIPDFSRADNSSTNPPEVESALGVVARESATGYRLTKDNKAIVYLNPEHMVIIDVANKKAQELISFKDWNRNLPGEGNVCVPGSRFVRPMFDGKESVIFFGAPKDGKDSLYMFNPQNKETTFITYAEDCITDIAVSPEGSAVAFQTSKEISTRDKGYITDLYIVNTASKEKKLVALGGKMPSDSLAGEESYDFAPAQVVFGNETDAYIKGFDKGSETGIWMYATDSQQLVFVRNLKGGP